MPEPIELERGGGNFLLALGRIRRVGGNFFIAAVNAAISEIHRTLQIKGGAEQALLVIEIGGVSAGNLGVFKLDSAAQKGVSMLTGHADQPHGHPV